MYVQVHVHTYHHCYNGNGVINAHEDSPGGHGKLDNTVSCLLPDQLSPPSCDQHSQERVLGWCP